MVQFLGVLFLFDRGLLAIGNVGGVVLMESLHSSAACFPVYLIITPLEHHAGSLLVRCSFDNRSVRDNKILPQAQKLQGESLDHSVVRSARCPDRQKNRLVDQWCLSSVYLQGSAFFLLGFFFVIYGWTIPGKLLFVVID